MNNNNTTYKPLGDYIRPVDIRNKDLKVTTLLGLSIEKCFIPSIANTIGTDMSTYKVVMPGQFAYGPVTSRNGDKITIALYTGDEPAIISQAYSVFEIVGECDTVETRRATSLQLLPEYLMMWFRRPEFDRYARYHSHGSAREIFDWAEMCATMVPVPPITEQRAVVADYEAVARRIAVAKRTIATLQATAQTLYRKMFVDGIDKENLPEGWRWGTLTDVATYMNGTACQNYATEEENYLPVLKIRELSQGRCDENSDRVSTDIPKEYWIHQGDIIFSWSATLFIDVWADVDCALNQHLFKVTSDKYPKWFFYLWTKSHIDAWVRMISAKATSMGHIKREDLEGAEVLIPSDADLKRQNKIFDPIFKQILNYKRETLKLTEIQTIMLSGMGR